MSSGTGPNAVKKPNNACRRSSLKRNSSFAPFEQLRPCSMNSNASEEGGLGGQSSRIPMPPGYKKKVSIVEKRKGGSTGSVQKRLSTETTTRNGYRKKVDVSSMRRGTYFGYQDALELAGIRGGGGGVKDLSKPIQLLSKCTGKKMENAADELFWVSLRNNGAKGFDY